ncbi:MAG TPA: hypothetical protein VGR78_01550 [Verrucomicrobiae bacterium]|nr:hypothetical protein [Verrucomicrobiae bacterium]
MNQRPISPLIVSRMLAQSDSLVEYDELSATGDDVVRRRYLLLKNDGRIEAGKKPSFERPKSEQDGELVPIESRSEPPEHDSRSSYIRLKPETRSFDLVDEGQRFRNSFAAGLQKFERSVR